MSRTWKAARSSGRSEADLRGSLGNDSLTEDQIRQIEEELRRPIAILADLQGPKLRVGRFAEGRVLLETGQRFVLDRDDAPGDVTRVQLPHREIFAAIEPGARLLLGCRELG